MDPWKDSVQQLWGQTGMWQYKCAELVRLNDKKSVHFQFSRCRIWATIFVAFSFSERVMPAQGLSKPSQSRIIWFLVYFNENIAVASEWETLPPRTHFGNVWKLWSESHLLVSDSLWPHGLYSPWNSPGQNTGVGSYSLLQGIFPTQGLYPGLLHCRKILYQLSYQWKLWTALIVGVGHHGYWQGGVYAAERSTSGPAELPHIPSDFLMSLWTLNHWKTYL